MAAAAVRETREADGRWKPGVSPNPGGMSKATRQLIGLIGFAHGPKILTALQALFDMGMDNAVDSKTRTAALGLFVQHTSQLSGIAGTARGMAEREEPPEDETALLERVVDTVMQRPEAREMVRQKLELVK